MGGEEALAAAGRLGRKNGKGFYDYDGGKRGSPGARGLRGPARRARATRSPLPAEVIEARLVLPMINEAAFCLEDGIVAEPGKLDLAMIFGTGFPPFRGGLLRYADALGLGPRLHAPRRPRRAARPALRAGRPIQRARQRAPRASIPTPHRPPGRSRHERPPADGTRRDPRLVPVVKSLFAGRDPGGHRLPVSRDRRRASARRSRRSSTPSAASRRTTSTRRRSSASTAIAPEVVRGLAELGAFGMTIPEAYGGYGFSASAYCRVTEEIGRTDASLGILIGGHQSIGLKGLILYGTEEQKKKWLPKLAVGRDDRGLRPDRAGGRLGRGLDPDDRRLRREDERVRPERHEALDLQRRLRRVLHGLRQGREARREGRAPPDHGLRRDEGPAAA